MPCSTAHCSTELNVLDRLETVANVTPVACHPLVPGGEPPSQKLVHGQARRVQHRQVDPVVGDHLPAVRLGMVRVAADGERPFV